MFEIFQLGVGGTSPVGNRALASAAIKVDGKGFLIDVGEGTQKEISKSGLTFLDIDYILITHLHADHIGGLFGLLMAMKESQFEYLNSMAELQEKSGKEININEKVLTIIGPYRIKEYVNQLLSISYGVPFQVKFIELGMKNPDLKLNVDNIVISSCKAKHGIPCFSYKIEYKRKRKFNPEKAKSLGIPVQFWKELAAEKTITYNNVQYDGNDFIGEKRKGFIVSYVTDTRPTQELREFIKNSDVAFVEGMYRDDSDQMKAKKNYHMTWREAGSLVNKNGINEVILTHFSPALILKEEDSKYLKSIIPNGVIGYDGLYRDLNFEEDKQKVFTDKNKKVYSKQYYVLCNFLKAKRFAFNSIEPVSSFKFIVSLNDKKYKFCVYKTTQSLKSGFKNIYSFEGYYIFEV